MDREAIKAKIFEKLNAVDDKVAAVPTGSPGLMRAVTVGELLDILLDILDATVETYLQERNK